MQRGGVQPTKLFIGGISRRTTTKQLRDHFSMYGCVLDCVAMRQPDGRPRGFGYVTLDSPAAADRLLREPQMIDDRYVDVKLAVPDTSSTSKCGPHKAIAPASQFGMWPTDGCMYPPRLGGLGLPGASMLPHPDMPWLWAENQVLDNLDAMHSDSSLPLGYTTPGFGSLDLTLFDQTAECPMLDCVELLTRQRGILGSAPPTPTQASPGDLPQRVPLAMTAPAKAPLSEVTNIILGASNAERGFAVKPDRRLTQFCTPKENHSLDFADQIYVDVEEAGSPTRLPTPLAALSSQSCSSASEPSSPMDCSSRPGLAVLVDADKDDESAADGDEEAMLKLQAMEATAKAEGLPSIGSAEHASGQCRRCNFFAKGRCRNGFDCVFCHFPHDRRKLSRQEKREAQAARRMCQSSENTAAPASQPERSESEEAVQQDSELPLSASSPAWVPEPSMKSIVAPQPTVALLPPGLSPPGLPSPCSTPSSQQLCGKASATDQAPVWSSGYFPGNYVMPHRVPGVSAEGPLLATRPPTPPAAGSTSALCMPPSPSSSRSPAPAKVQVRTISTQTDEPYRCPHCGSCQASCC